MRFTDNSDIIELNNYSGEFDSNKQAAYEALLEERSIDPEKTNLEECNYTYNVFGFTIDIEPKGAGRPRKGRNSIYEPPQDRDYKRIIKSRLNEIFDLDEPISGEFDVHVDLFFPIPKGFSKKKALAAELGHLLPITIPDLDNCEKIFLDALNPRLQKEDQIKDGEIVKAKKVPKADLFTGIWTDDKTIVKLSSSKFYSCKPRIEATIAFRIKDE